MFHQDWAPVVFTKKPNPKDPNAKKETKVKDKTHNERAKLNKLEKDIYSDPTSEAPELAKLNILSPEMRQTLIQARVSKKLNQVQLANQVNVRPNIIQDLETGKVVQDKNILQKIKKVLNVQLKFGV